MTKKLRYFCTLLLMAVVSVAWADTGTITFSGNGVKINSANVTGDDNLGNTWTITTEGTTSFTSNTAYYQVGSGSKPASSITFTTTLSEDVNIESMSAKFGGFNGTAGTITLKVGETEIGTGSLNATNDVTVNSNSTAVGKVLTITVTGISKGVKVYNISYTYSAASGDTPSITTEDVNIDYDATDGVIAYTVNNPVSGGSVNATTTADWLTLSENFESPIAFTCETNDGAERTATVTLTYSYGDDQTVTKDVTVTQAEYIQTVSGYSIDFESAASAYTDWTFANMESQQTGNSNVTAHGGTYYGTTGGKASASITTKAKIATPNTLTCYVTKQSTNTTASNWKIEVSSDGAEWTTVKEQSATSMSAGTWVELTANLTSYTDVYVRVSYNGSTAIRNIDDLVLITEASTEPSIAVSPEAVEVEAAGATGELTVTTLNMGEGIYEIEYVDAAGAAATYNWLTAEMDAEGTTITYTVSANTSTEERVAYLRVYGITEGGEDVYSNVVTFTQAGYIEPTTYSLATSITHGIHYIIVSSKEDGAAKAMGSQTSNNRASADVTINNGKATVNSADVYEFVISGPNADGFYTIYDENTNSTGYLYAASSGSNHLRTQETNDANGMWSIEFDSETNAATIKAQGSNTRNWMRFNSSNGIFSCYGSGQQDIYLFAKDNDEPSSVLVTIRDGFTATTFSSDKALDFTNADVTAQIITDEQGTTQDVTVVPAETGLYITGQPGVHEISVADASAETDNVDSNKLKAVLEASEFATQNDVTFYAFGKQKGKEAFYKIPTSGYNVPAGKAVLRILKNSANAPEMIVVNGGTTGVESIENSQLTIDNYYTVDGRLVNGKPTQKGIYIVGGRKVVVK